MQMLKRSASHQVSTEHQPHPQNISQMHRAPATATEHQPRRSFSSPAHLHIRPTVSTSPITWPWLRHHRRGVFWFQRLPSGRGRDTRLPTLYFVQGVLLSRRPAQQCQQHATTTGHLARLKKERHWKRLAHANLTNPLWGTRHRDPIAKYQLLDLGAYTTQKKERT